MSDVFEYHRTKLNRRYDNLYADIFLAVKNRQKTLEVTGVDYDAVVECYNAVYYDHAELFYMSYECTAEVSRSLRGGRITIMFAYIYDEREALAINRKIAAAAGSVRGVDKEDTENKIVELIVRNTVYEIDNMRNQNMASALYYGKAQCSGIAKAVKYLCDCNNIRCIFVNGSIKTSVGGPHAWNIIEINGNYYHLDVTTILASNPAGAATLFKPCFNWTDSQMLATHGWDKKLFPACIKTYAQPVQSNGGHRATQNRTPPVQAGSGSAGKGSTATQNRTQPAQSNRGRAATQSCTPPQMHNYGQNVKKLATLSQLRAYVEEQLKAQRKDISFILSVGATAEERLKLITNSVKMVMVKLHMSGSIGVEIVGDVNTLKIR